MVLSACVEAFGEAAFLLEGLGLGCELAAEKAVRDGDENKGGVGCDAGIGGRRGEALGGRREDALGGPGGPGG